MVSVSADGEVFPCHMMHDEAFSLGSLVEDPSCLSARHAPAPRVDELAACEVLPMTGSYAPLDTATLADLVTTLYAASDDGETGASYEQAAQWAAEKGMVLTGGADDALTRGAAMELLYAAFGALNITADPV